MSPRRPDIPRLKRAELAADPIAQFEEWWRLAAEEVPLPEAMTLATVDEHGAPDARMVLLKGFGSDGFRFFTNYESAKAAQLDAAGRAALVIYWRELDRQVRVRGTVERLSAEDADEYFATRPRESQLGAWVSPQSKVIPEGLLEERLREFEARFEGRDVPRPPHWGGYLVRHEVVEFWQGRPGRVHDRFRYSRDGDGWRIDRVGP
ncbi:MAG TPA: pyridoxamine 5'-phosphate oxidase [Solirubrobacterales bacterium]